MAKTQTLHLHRKDFYFEVILRYTMPVKFLFLYCGYGAVHNTTVFSML